MWNSKLVVLDEPTAALGVAQTEQVLELVRRLGSQGLGVMLISHNLHDVFETADRITVLRLGRNVGVFERRETTQQAVVEAITAGTPTKVSGIPSHRGRGSRDVSSADVVGAGQAPPPLEEEQLPGGLRGVWERAWLNVRTGNLGADPDHRRRDRSSSIFFAFTATNFFTSVNFVNLITETAGTAMLAYGVVFVLLLGEIDLSIGYLAGIGALIVAELQLPGQQPADERPPRDADRRRRLCA